MLKLPHKFTVLSGFTLVEVLIAMSIFSIGLLGIAGLQISGLRLSHDSLVRTYAHQLASDMADRIRANRTAAQMGINSPYNNPNALSSGVPSCLGLDTLGNFIDAECTAMELAQNDFYEWYGLLQGQSATGWHGAINSLLPSANGIVCIDSTPNDGAPNAPACDNISSTSNVFTIKIWWSERKDGGTLNNSTHQFVTTLIP